MAETGPKPFKTKRLVDFPSGTDTAEHGMTLSDHILSLDPHPNARQSDGGGDDSSIAAELNHHIAPRIQSDNGNVTDSPHVDRSGAQLYAGYKHNHDERYAGRGHLHTGDDPGGVAYALASHTHSDYATTSYVNELLNNFANKRSFVVVDPRGTLVPGTDDKYTEQHYDANDYAEDGSYLFLARTYDKYNSSGSLITANDSVILSNMPTSVAYPFSMTVKTGTDENLDPAPIHIEQKILDGAGLVYVRYGSQTGNNAITWESWQEPSNYIDLSKPAPTSTNVYLYNSAADDGKGVGSYTVKKTGWVLIITCVKCMVSCRFGSGVEFPLQGGAGDEADMAGYQVFYLKKNTSIEFKCYDDNYNESGAKTNWNTGRHRLTWNNKDNIVIYEYGP